MSIGAVGSSVVCSESVSTRGVKTNLATVFADSATEAEQGCDQCSCAGYDQVAAIHWTVSHASYSSERSANFLRKNDVVCEMGRWICTHSGIFGSAGHRSRLFRPRIMKKTAMPIENKHTEDNLIGTSFYFSPAFELLLAFIPISWSHRIHSGFSQGINSSKIIFQLSKKW